MNEKSRQESSIVSIRRRVLSVPTLLSFFIAAAFILFLATRFDIDWSATWMNVREINPWLYLAAFVVYFASFWFRGIRWRIIARNADIGSDSGGQVPSVVTCSSLIIIGWFVNSVAWLRLGDAYRGYAFAEDSKHSFSWSLGTILAERVMDMATIFLVILVSVLLLATTQETVGTRIIVVAAFAMAFGLVVIIAFMRVYGTRLERVLPGRLQRPYKMFHQGTLGSFKQLPTLFVLGLIGWVMEMARLYFVVQAMGIELNPVFIPIVAMGHAILSTVPTPGGVGVVEPGVTGLLLLSLARSDAVSIALVDRSITYLGVIAVGGIVFLLRQSLATGRRSEPQKSQERTTV